MLRSELPLMRYTRSRLNQPPAFSALGKARTGRDRLTRVVLVLLVVFTAACVPPGNSPQAEPTSVTPSESTTTTTAQTVATTTAAAATTTTAEVTTSETDADTGPDVLYGLLSKLSTDVENPDGFHRADYEHHRRYLCDKAGVDPYTGLSYEPSTCDVDHIVAAKEAHESGGHAWDVPTRQRFGNDEANLVPSRDCVNRSKGSRDQAEWSGVKGGQCAGAELTPAGQCFWAARTVDVKYRYGLSVDTDERAALRAAIANCPDDIDVDTPPRATTIPSAPTDTGGPAVSPSDISGTDDCHPAYQPCLPNLPGDALNCGDLTAAQRPVRVKEIGVDPYRLDQDNNGHACG